MRRETDAAVTVHASCVVLGEDGILIRGPSGAGKSTLARRLIDIADRAGRYGALVADDRVRLSVAGGRLIAYEVASVAGMLEIRGLGIVRTSHEPACVVRLVVDLVDAEPERLPRPDNMEVEILHTRLPRLATTPLLAPELVLWRLRG